MLSENRQVLQTPHCQFLTYQVRAQGGKKQAAGIKPSPPHLQEKKKKGGRSLARGARRLPPQREMPSGGLMQATRAHPTPKRRWLALCPSCIRPGLDAGHRRRRSGLERGLALGQGYTWSSAGGYLPKVSCDAVSRRVAVVSGKPITKPDGGEAGHEIYWARGERGSCRHPGRALPGAVPWRHVRLLLVPGLWCCRPRCSRLDRQETSSAALTDNSAAIHKLSTHAEPLASRSFQLERFETPARSCLGHGMPFSSWAEGWRSNATSTATCWRDFKARV